MTTFVRALTISNRSRAPPPENNLHRAFRPFFPASPQRAPTSPPLPMTAPARTRVSAACRGGGPSQKTAAPPHSLRRENPRTLARRGTSPAHERRSADERPRPFPPRTG